MENIQFAGLLSAPPHFFNESEFEPEQDFVNLISRILARNIEQRHKPCLQILSSKIGEPSGMPEKAPSTSQTIQPMVNSGPLRNFAPTMELTFANFSKTKAHQAQRLTDPDGAGLRPTFVRAK
jgi:hypothetical protein